MSESEMKRRYTYENIDVLREIQKEYQEHNIVVWALLEF